MTLRAQRIIDVFDRFVPPELTSKTARQRAQLAVLFAFVGAFASFSFCVSGPALGANSVSVLLFGLVAAGDIMVPVVIRLTKSVSAGGNLVAAMWLVSVATGIYLRGGIDTPAAMAVTPLPLLATVLAGWRSGVFWTVLSLALLALATAAPELGLQFKDQIDPDVRTQFALGSSISMLLVIVLLSLGFVAIDQRSRASVATAVRKRRAAENNAQLLRAGRLAALGEVASSLAHEINNPLMYVMANLEFIAESDKLSEDSSEAVADATDGAQRIASIVRDLKAYASSDEGTIERVDLGVVAHSTARLVRGYARKRARLEVQVREAPSISGSWGQLGQVVINLVVNAAQAIEKGHPERNLIILSTGVDDGSPFIRVSDTGCGIGQDELAHVMEAFYTTSHGTGTGLGLTVTRNIVEELDGMIDIESTLGEGTSVTVRFEAPPKLSTRDKRLTLPKSIDELRVLVVDEDPLIGAALGRMLVEHSLSVVGSLSEALKRIGQETFDLVLIDVTPGASLDWFETLKQEKPQVAACVVFLTVGGADEESLEPYRDRVALKPLGRDRLRELIGLFAGS